MRTSSWRSRSFAFSGLEGRTCRLPVLPTPHVLLRPLGHLLRLAPGQPLLRCRPRRSFGRAIARLLRRLPLAGCDWSRSPAACEVSVASPCADLDLGTSGGAEPPGPSLTFSAARPSAGTADPAVAWSRQFAQVVAEILAGARSPRQIAPWTTERVRDRIILLTQTLSAGQKPRIRRIMTSRPAARVVEMTVVLSFGS